jgi:hypothetical protein
LLIADLSGFSPSQSDDGVASIAFSDRGDELELVCEKFGLDPADFQRCLVSRSFGIRSIVTCMFSVNQVYHHFSLFSLIGLVACSDIAVAVVVGCGCP